MPTVVSSSLNRSALEEKKGVWFSSASLTRSSAIFLDGAKVLST
ncbi:MAG: hypothetical protein ACLUFV_02965 [Acutalibacteraceae bacterium]